MSVSLCVFVCMSACVCARIVVVVIVVAVVTLLSLFFVVFEEGACPNPCTRARPFLAYVHRA